MDKSRRDLVICSKLKPKIHNDIKLDAMRFLTLFGARLCRLALPRMTATVVGRRDSNASTRCKRETLITPSKHSATRGNA